MNSKWFAYLMFQFFLLQENSTGKVEQENLSDSLGRHELQFRPIGLQPVWLISIKRFVNDFLQFSPLKEVRLGKWFTFERFTFGHLLLFVNRKRSEPSDLERLALLFIESLLETIIMVVQAIEFKFWFKICVLNRSSRLEFIERTSF